MRIWVLLALCAGCLPVGYSWGSSTGWERTPTQCESVGIDTHERISRGCE